MPAGPTWPAVAGQRLLPSAFEATFLMRGEEAHRVPPRGRNPLQEDAGAGAYGIVDPPSNEIPRIGICDARHVPPILCSKVGPVTLELNIAN